MRPLPLIPTVACLLLLAVFPGHAFGVVTRPVHVQEVTASSVKIVWHTEESSTGSVDYGPTLDYGFSTSAKQPLETHVVTLHGLDPGTLYFYRVRCGSDTLYTGPDYHVRTLPDKRANRFRFLVWGDSGRDNAEQYSLIPAMEYADPDFMIHVGDVMQEDGASGEFDPCFFVPYQDLLRNTAVWPAMGNHDYKTNDGQPFLDAFYLPRNPAGNERYYSFTYGQAHFVVLDTNSALDDEVLAWLEHELAWTTTKWKFAYMHHPMYSCGAHGSDHGIRNTLAPIFQEYGVDVVFSGHDHDFQRSYPLLNREIMDAEQDPFYTDPAGIVYIGTGGGSTVRPTSSSCDYTAVAVSKTHFTLVDIADNRMYLRAIDTDGQIFDKITIDKLVGAQEVSKRAVVEPAGARLLENVPNPFNPATLLRYELYEAMSVELVIHDSGGRRIRRMQLEGQQPGTHGFMWDGRDARGRRVASGMYFVRLLAGENRLTRKIILVR